MPAHRSNRLLAALLATFATAAVAAPGAGAADARYEGMATSGAVTFFSTTDKLVPGDTDSKRDIYERSLDEDIGGYVTRQVSFGQTGGNNAFDVQFLASDEAGVRVFFTTNERLTGEDKDTATDVYVRDLDENKTTLVSAGDPGCVGSGCGNANKHVVASTGGIVADGLRVVFSSDEKLSADDEDSTFDVYVRDLDEPQRTILASTAEEGCGGAECGNGPVGASFQGASADGSSVVFTTTEALDSDTDADALTDIYEHDVDSEETRLVSTTGTCPALLDCTPVYAGISTDGGHVYFESNERASGLDSDSSQDVYDWSAGALAIASQGPAGGNDDDNALFAGNAPDGGAAFFETRESLDSADGDSGQDVYEFAAGTTSLVSRRAATCEPPTCGGGALDASLVDSNGIPGIYGGGSKVFFLTAERLVPEDGDASFDVYLRDLAIDSTTLVSEADPSCSIPTCGDGPNDVNLAGASQDGSHALLVTNEALVDADTDSQKDIYDRNGGQTKLVSSGSINGNGPYGAQPRGISADGETTVFVTSERLTDEDDLLGQEDVYRHAGNGTLLVSRGNDSEVESQLAPPPPVLERTEPGSPSPSTEPAVIGFDAEAASSVKIYATAGCTGEPIATGSAEALADPGIPVSVAPGSTTTFVATAEAEGFVSGCSAPLTYKQQNETPPPPPPGEEGSGSGAGGGIGGGGTQVPGDPKLPKVRSYVTPVPRITFGPASKTRIKRPVFRFTDATGQDGTKFVCKVDRAKWRGCSSPLRLKPLGRGRHVFRVSGINGAGTQSPRPSSRSFRLVAGARR